MDYIKMIKEDQSLTVDDVDTLTQEEAKTILEQATQSEIDSWTQ
jgi:hypothetical protein